MCTTIWLLILLWFPWLLISLVTSITSVIFRVLFIMVCTYYFRCQCSFVATVTRTHQRYFVLCIFPTSLTHLGGWYNTYTNLVI